MTVEKKAIAIKGTKLIVQQSKNNPEILKITSWNREWPLFNLNEIKEDDVKQTYHLCVKEEVKELENGEFFIERNLSDEEVEKAKKHEYKFLEACFFLRRYLVWDDIFAEHIQKEINEGKLDNLKTII